MPHSFTHDEYRRLLRRTRDHYSFRGFEVLDSGWCDEDRFAIIRHDIDMSPARARDLAALEAEESVRSTYTVLLTSDFYNALESRTRDYLREIVDLGHDLGLHFDAQWHAVGSDQEVESAVRWQADIVEQALGAQIRCFSFHNTTPFSMGCHASHYGGLRNAYAGQLQAEVSYISDSNGMWRFRSWDQLLDEQLPRIQILTHPDWWTAEPLAPAQKICMELEERSREVWHHYCELLDTGGKPNECDIAEMLPTLRKIDPDASRLWLSGFPLEAIVRVSQQAAMIGPSEDVVARARELLVESMTTVAQVDSAGARDTLSEIISKLSRTRTE